ncbi:hypothetical protein ACQPXT_13150 [Streptomyces sp. CA-100214]
MPSPTRPLGALRRARNSVNTAIRRLMSQPPSRERTEQYERLLVRWRELHENDYVPAA